MELWEVIGRTGARTRESLFGALAKTATILIVYYGPLFLDP